LFPGGCYSSIALVHVLCPKIIPDTIEMDVSRWMANSELYIDVLVPLPLDGPFTYRVPEALKVRADVGKRVLVPFGKKIRAGFIVAISDSAPQDHEIKDVLDIPEEPPYVSPSLWSFLSWMAEYYMLPFGLVLRTALPPGSDRKSKSWAIITREGLSSEECSFPVSFLKARVMLRKDLEALISPAHVEQAVSRGWISLEERIARPRISLKTKEIPELLYGPSENPKDSESIPTLTGDQAVAVEQMKTAVSSAGFHAFLLFGVTGSGKTEVYLRLIQEVIDRNKKALVLVPEIALTPQLARRFLRRVRGKVGIFHSGLTPSQRLDEWRRVKAGKVDVAIAARSGIFLPMDDLGLIVVDEEHDPSYKQEDSCPYNARDMALARGKLESACVVLGSATPSFESFLNARNGKITRVDLPVRFHGGALPQVELVDLRESKSIKKAFLTPTLLESIRHTLEQGEQVVLFLNRRGFDTFAQCSSCGHVFKCPNCDISLTHHKKARDLRCHLCGFSRAAPPLCPKCAGEKLFFGGVGTQKVEEELQEVFPEARTGRLDRDSTRKREELGRILDRFRKREIDILVGTQMIVKGHDFPGIGLVGVLCGDLSLHFPDFRAAERTFQILAQVAGRTGRGSDSGRVLLQTYDPEHEVIRFAASHEYTGFFEYDTEMRRELYYPPFGHLILIRVEGNSEKRVENKALEIGRAARMAKQEFPAVSILGPAPSPRKKMVGRFRWQLLFKSVNRSDVRGLVKQLKSGDHLQSRGLKIVIDVDPVDLM
jgi:primosomal protein N' (replication factor Y)